jgi:aryl-phospho-beta-D-glucosidase BglC (GH1 family)
MPPIRIYPRYKLLMMYDIRPELYEPYFQYIMSEFVPALQNMGLYMITAWHTAYGDYPVRLIEFVSEDLETMLEIFQSDRWDEMESQLKTYITNYERKVVRFRQGFQF